MEDAYTATSNERVDLTIEEEEKLKKENERKTTDRKAFVKESSPLLFVQSPISERDGTVEMGRTVFPSSSTPDLSTTAESLTISDTTTVVTTEVMKKKTKYKTNHYVV